MGSAGWRAGSPGDAIEEVGAGFVGIACGDGGVGGGGRGGEGGGGRGGGGGGADRGGGEGGGQGGGGEGGGEGGDGERGWARAAVSPAGMGLPCPGPCGRPLLPPRLPPRLPPLSLSSATFSSIPPQEPSPAMLATASSNMPMCAGADVVVDADVSRVTRLVGLVPPHLRQLHIRRWSNGAEGLLPLSLSGSWAPGAAKTKPTRKSISQQEPPPLRQ